MKPGGGGILPYPALSRPAQGGKHLLTQAQSKEIIGTSVLGEVPVEDFLKFVKFFVSQLCPQLRGGGVIVLFRLPEFRELAAEIVDLSGKIGIAQEQCGENFIHDKQLLHMRFDHIFIIGEV